MGRSEGSSDKKSSPQEMDCPQAIIWFSIATGLLPNAKAIWYLHHAGQCRFCATLLKNAMEDVATDEPTPETQQNLRSTQRAWQEELARQMDLLVKPKRQAGMSTTPVAFPGRHGAKIFRLPTRAYAAAAAIAVVLGIVLWWLCRVSPEKLLQEAYAQERTVELRLGQTAYTPYLVQRGAAALRIHHTSALYEADAAIGRELAKRPKDPGLLRDQGNVELLQWHFDAAIQSFQKAQDIAPDMLLLKLDLAVAYFERAEVAGKAIDYSKAYELIGEVLAKNPKDPVTLFNHAIICDRMFFFHEEISDWERYLQLDPRGSWADEARQRLAEASDKLREYDRKRAEPLLNPTEFLRNVSTANESTWRIVDLRIEEYLDSAIREWLPQAFPVVQTASAEQPAHDAQAALERLASILARRHDDRWLADLLVRRPSPAFSSGLLHLSRAAARNAAGDADAAGEEAGQALRWFSQGENIPGMVRARLEVVYALHLRSQGLACREAALPIVRQLSGKSYSWIHGQFLLEEHTCFRMTGDIKQAGLALASARKIADKAGFGVLLLRALAFEASLNWSAKGNERRAWTLYHEGLDHFWTGNYPEIRAYEFYAGLCFPAENHGYWQLAFGCSTEAAILAERAGSTPVKPFAYFRVSRMALMAGKAAQSKAEQQIAQKLFAALPPGPAKESYYLDTEIRNASIEAAQGEPALALARLNALESLLHGVSNDFKSLDYFQELGDVKRKIGDLKGAEQSYRSAIATVQAGFSTLARNERTGWQKTVEAAYKGLAETQSLANNARQSLETWESYHALPLRETAPDQVEAQHKLAVRVSEIEEPASAEVQSLAPFQLRSALPSLRHETIISYALFSNGLAIWAYDDRGITSRFVLVSSDELTRVAHRFNQECADPDSDITALRRDGQTLYQWLIAPVESSLEPSRLIVIEPDGVLGQVAIEALEDSTHQYFGMRYSVAFTPGLAYYLQGRLAKGINADSPSLIVASSLVPLEYLEILRPLPDAVREAQIVGRILGRSTVLNGKEVTEKELLQRLAHVEIFHFAGHAVTTAEGVGLVLASSNGEAKFIDAHVFRKSQFKDLRLVVLSACSTAQAEENDAAGQGNLIEALLQTGVPRAIGSYWNVDSKITVTLIQTLYQSIAAGKPVPDALHDAVLRSKAVNAHPYFWATFHVWI